MRGYFFMSYAEREANRDHINNFMHDFAEVKIKIVYLFYCYSSFIKYFRHMITNFYPIDIHRNSQLKYAIVGSRYQFNQWIFVQHKERNTWEIPAGHIEKGEQPDTAARRELYEETGAEKFRIYPLMDYSVTTNGQKTFGRVYMAEIEELGNLPEFEIEKIQLFNDLPKQLTYPEIQPFIFEKIKQVIL